MNTVYTHKTLAEMHDRMNKEIEQFARDALKENLTYLGIANPTCLDVFRRMYSHKDLTRPIGFVVDTMPAEKLDWALSQSENSIKNLPKVAAKEV